MICCSQKYNNVSKIAAWCGIDEMLQLADQWGQQVVPQLLDHKCAALTWTEGWNLDAIWLYVAELWLQWVNCLVLVEPLVCGQCNPPMGFPWSFITFPLTQLIARPLPYQQYHSLTSQQMPDLCLALFPLAAVSCLTMVHTLPFLAFWAVALSVSWPHSLVSLLPLFLEDWEVAQGWTSIEFWAVCIWGKGCHCKRDTGPWYSCIMNILDPIF